MKRVRRLLRLSSERLYQYKAFFQHSPYGIFSLDKAGNIQSANPALEAMVGHSLAEFAGRSFVPLIAPESLAVTLANVERIYRGEGRQFEATLMHRDGHKVIVDFSSFPLMIQGKVEGLFGIAKDITRRKRAEALVAKQAAAMDTVSDGIAIIDDDGSYLYLNTALSTLFGWDKADLVGRNWRSNFAPAEVARMEVEVLPEIAARGTWFGQLNGCRPDGTLLPIEATVNRIPDGGFVLAVRDITERLAFEQLLSHEAHHDPLTNLPNRKLLLQRLEEAVARSGQTGAELAVIFLDLDGFKQVNDTYGHEAGDVILTQAAERLQACLRSSDTIARLGGDEFIILVDGVSGTEAVEEIAERVTAALTCPFIVEGLMMRLSAAVGFALGMGRPVEQIIREADAAMYRMKQSPR